VHLRQDDKAGDTIVDVLRRRAVCGSQQQAVAHAIASIAAIPNDSTNRSEAIAATSQAR
jgi:hypothetical protein